MTDAADPQQAVVRHERTSEPDLNKVQRGWQIYDRAGERIGVVVERDDASVVIADDPSAGGGERLPIRLIADEQPDERRATLSITASDARRTMEHERE